MPKKKTSDSKCCDHKYADCIGAGISEKGGVHKYYLLILFPFK